MPIVSPGEQCRNTDGNYEPADPNLGKPPTGLIFIDSTNRFLRDRRYVGCLMTVSISSTAFTLCLNNIFN